MDNDYFLAWWRHCGDPEILFSSCRGCFSANEHQQLLHSEAEGSSSSSSSSRRLRRRTMLCSQDVDQRRWRRHQRPSSTDDGSCELSPEEEEPFPLSTDENNNDNDNNNNNGEDDDEQQLKFSIDKILSADFGQTDCRQQQQHHHSHYRNHHHHHHTPATTNCTNDKRLNNQQQQLQQQGALDAEQRVTGDRWSITSLQLSADDCANGGKTMRRKTRGIRADAEKMKRETSTATKQHRNLEERRMGSASASSAALSGYAARSDCAGLPAWIFCTRYSDRPSSGPRSRKSRRRRDIQGEPESGRRTRRTTDEKRVRTCFTDEQLDRLKTEFKDNPYLTEERRSKLSKLLNLTEVQVKIWFQNKRAKMKKSILATSSLSSSSSTSTLSSSAAVAAISAAAHGSHRLSQVVSSATSHVVRLADNGLYNCKISITDCGRRHEN